MKTIPDKSHPVLLEHVRELLDADRTAAAMEALSRVGEKGLSLRNAQGVCLLRAGRYDEAVRLFRDLAFPSGGNYASYDVPTEIQANYAAALLLSGQVCLGKQVLEDISDQKHPAVVRLRSAFHAWAKRLGWARRLLMLAGSYPREPVSLPFPAGDIWTPRAA